jgi:hypothetical protein
MPVSDDRANFKEYWRGGSKPDQDNHDQHNHDGRDRVHHDAYCAMVGVAFGRMNVRHLDNSQKRQQDQAHYRRHFQSTSP